MHYIQNSRPAVLERIHVSDLGGIWSPQKIYSFTENSWEKGRQTESFGMLLSFNGHFSN